MELVDVALGTVLGRFGLEAIMQSKGPCCVHEASSQRLLVLYHECAPFQGPLDSFTLHGLNPQAAQSSRHGSASQ